MLVYGPEKVLLECHLQSFPSIKTSVEWYSKTWVSMTSVKSAYFVFGFELRRLDFHLAEL